VPATTQGADQNPCNAWQNQIDKEPNGRFAIFDTPENGIRALGKLLINFRCRNAIPSVGGNGIDAL